jgi:poly(A) polymerase
LAPVWLDAPALRRLFAALGAPRLDVRAVGGSVRDALLGRDRPDSEIDLGTPEPPAAVIERLAAAGVRTIPTGLDHGTVTAVVDGRSFEITSLRRDTACDGRHAAVEFTADWHEDARRRDFTFNAMSLMPDGTLHDDHGGIADLRAGSVRFVGDPADRIREDYLRILRLFRFQAHVGRAPLDEATLAACRAHRDGLARLSAERVQSELAKLLSAADPAPAVAAMHACAVLERLLPVADGGERLARLIAAESAAARADAPWLRRLAALIAPGTATMVADRLKLSNADRAQLDRLAAAEPVVTPATPPPALRRALHDAGAEVIRDRALLAWAAQPDLDRPTPAPAWRVLLGVIDAWTPALLPVGGSDVLALGIPPGPRVGRLLAEMLDWWLAADRRPDRAALLAELARRAAVP